MSEQAKPALRLDLLPTTHPLRNTPLAEIGAEYKWTPAKAGWRRVAKGWGIAKATFNRLGRAWTYLTEWRAYEQPGN